MRSSLRAHLGPALLAILLLACSGSSGPTRGFFAQAAVGPGGALAVDGVSLEVDGAVLRLLDDGEVVTAGSADALAARLRPGMVVWLRGALRGSTVRVEEIVHRGLARGPLAGRGESALAVAGVEALLGPETAVLDAAGLPVSPDALPAGTRLAVDGWPEGRDGVRATAVRALGGDGPLRLRGYSVAAPVGGVFQLALAPGGEPVLAVDASGLPGAGIPAAARVRVEGPEIAGGLLTATDVAVEAEALPFPGDLAVVEGVVTAAGADGLRLGPHRVDLTAGVVYDGVPAGGSAAAALAPGARVVVRGRAKGDALQAERVRLVGVVRHAGRASHFQIGQPATMAVLAVEGVDVVLGDYTLITDAAGAKRSIAELLALHGAEPLGLPIAVHGYPRADGSVRAYRVEVVVG